MTARDLDFFCANCSFLFSETITEKYLPEIFCPRCYKTVEKEQEITEEQEIDLIMEEVNEERKAYP